MPQVVNSSAVAPWVRKRACQCGRRFCSIRRYQRSGPFQPCTTVFSSRKTSGLAQARHRLGGRILIHEIEFAPEIKEQTAADVHRSLVDYLVVRRDPLLDEVGRVGEREIRCHSRHPIHHAEADRHHRGGEGGESQPRPFLRDKPEGDDREKDEGEPGGDEHRAKTQPGGNRDFAQGTPGRGTRRGRPHCPSALDKSSGNRHAINPATMPTRGRRRRRGSWSSAASVPRQSRRKSRTRPTCSSSNNPAADR